MVSWDFIVPTFFANQLSIFGEMTLGMIIKIMQVAADIENHAPDQNAAGQFDSLEPSAWIELFSGWASPRT